MNRCKLCDGPVLESRNRRAAVADPGGWGACHIFIVAQYSVLNCILNAQLQKASARHIPLPHPTPFGEHACFSLHYHIPLLVPPPPPPFKIPGSAPEQSGFNGFSDRDRNLGESMSQDICVQDVFIRSRSTWHFKKNWRALERTYNQRSPSVCALNGIVCALIGIAGYLVH